MYLGLSLQALIISDLKAKQILSIAEYCEKENIKIGILKDVYNSKVAKEFSKNNIVVIDQIDVLDKIYLSKN
ncbi:MAG: hypothetical protein MJ219_00885 [Mycoplasmoidaceae bacterium]|nr:hypothetical protein [Mycoplasmoidaceae bacterium]